MLQNNIVIHVKERVITVQQDYTNPVAGNVSHDFLVVNFDHEWDSLDKRVTFSGTSGDTITITSWDGESPLEIPWESIQSSGRLKLTIVGSEDGVDRLVTTTMTDTSSIEVIENGTDEGVSPSAPSQDVIAHVEAVASDLEAKANSGYFKGDKGDTPIKGTDYFTQADINLVASQTAKLVSTFTTHVCASGEYSNGVPTISSPNLKTIYFVPDTNGTNDVYTEWLYINSKWEQIGTGRIDFSQFLKKPSTYSASADVAKTDILLKQASDGTITKVTADNAAIELTGLISAENHRNVYRGKYLGTAVTDAQKTAISSGTFDDLFIGDYWTINSVNWRIADMDYWYNCGDTAFTKHHLVIVPENNLYLAVMNETNITTGAYVGSQMYTTNLEQAKTKATDAFGDMVLTHRLYLPNATSNGYQSAGAWYDSTVELMNEIMVYGCHVFAAMGTGSVVPNKYTCEKTQLALFRLVPNFINRNRSWYWLRDVVSSALFAAVYGNGHADYAAASYSCGVRPAFPIGVA